VKDDQHDKQLGTVQESRGRLAGVADALLHGFSRPSRCAEVSLCGDPGAQIVPNG
jgi:hypothetical protein